MAKSKQPTNPVATAPKGIPKETSNGDFVQPQDLNFSHLSAKIRTQFQNLEEDRKKRSQQNHKPRKAKKDKASDFEQRKPKHAEQSPHNSAPRGKKRGHNGQVLPKHQEGKSKPPENEQHGGTDLLEAEVIALGGTAEDMSLFEGVESESEFENDGVTQTRKEDSAQRHAGLQKGITNILKEIALVHDAADADEDSTSANASEGGVIHEGWTSQPTFPASSAAAPSTSSTEKPAPSRRGQDGLIFEARADWFNLKGPDVERTKPLIFTLPRSSLDQLHNYAKSLLDADNDTYKKHQQSKSSQSFYSTVIASGTLSDKISALTLAIQESPVHNVKALETLVGLAKKRSRAQAVDVLRALKDLFAQGSLLPSDRKLHTFNSNPEVFASFGESKSWKPGDALPRAVRPQHLISWAYESWLKEVYFEVLKTLEVWCNDEIEFSKTRAVSYVFELLKEKPEQEANLLRMLVNKLGDPVKKVASQTSYLIMQLMTAHPAMKETIIVAIEAELLYRPGQSLHAKYYAIVTLNQTILSKAEESLARKLLDIYFGLFVGLLKPAQEGKAEKVVASGPKVHHHSGRHRKVKHAKKSVDSSHVQEDELKDKLTSALLTGINRAYPYAGASYEKLSNHLDALFKVTHSSNFNTSIQAMILIQQLSSLHRASHDRFYRTLYESLLDARLITSSKQSLYLNLLFRALKADVNQKRVKAFVKRITQVLTLHQPSFVCGAFFLLKELESTFPSLSGLIDQVEEHEADEEAFHDVEDNIREADQVPHTSASTQAGKGHAYDGRKRDPEHSHAENSCLWELLPFLAHYHPSVAVSADHVLRHAKLPGKPDLNLHTLIHFLDRFVYRNPKASSSSLRGSSIMQPLAASESSGLHLGGLPSGQQTIPVNASSFKTLKEEDVAAEDVFFHKYFNNLAREKSTAKSKAQPEIDKGSAADGDESEIWKAMMESAPDLEGVHDSDDDIEMDDLDSDFERSLDEMSSELDEDTDDLGEDDKTDDDTEHLEKESPDDLDSGLGLDEDASGEANLLPPAKKHRESLPSKNPNKRRRKRLKGLPTFASASDYARMLDDDEGEDLG
jgi:ribosome biogenesis protein MAK21